MFDRALTFAGRSRERLLAIHVAHALTARLFPVEYESIYTSRAVGVREKLSPAAEALQSESIAAVFERPVSVVREGLASGDLPRSSGVSPEQLIYGLWSLHYGKIMLETSAFPFLRLAVKEQRPVLRRTFHGLLDGLAWRPLATEHDYAAVERRIEREIFAAELKQVRSSGTPK
jgi:hypothetical protein